MTVTSRSLFRSNEHVVQRVATAACPQTYRLGLVCHRIKRRIGLHISMDTTVFRNGCTILTHFGKFCTYILYAVDILAFAVTASCMALRNRELHASNDDDASCG